MQYQVRNKAAQAIHQAHWKGHVEWPKVDPCADCPLLAQCSNGPKVRGIEAYVIWIAAINEEAERVEKSRLSE